MEHKNTIAMNSLKEEILKKLDDSLHLHELPRNKIFEIKDDTRVNPLFETPFIFNITARLQQPLTIQEVKLAPFVQKDKNDIPLQYKHDQITLIFEIVLQVRLKENTEKAQYMLGIASGEYMPAIYHQVFTKTMTLEYVTEPGVPELTRLTEASLKAYSEGFDLAQLSRCIVNTDHDVDVPNIFYYECDSIQELYLYEQPGIMLKKLTSNCKESSLPHITNSLLKESIKKRKEKEGRLYSIDFTNNFSNYLNNVSHGAEVFGGMGLFDEAVEQRRLAMMSSKKH